MEIRYLKSCPSTQNLIVEDLRIGGFIKPYAVIADEQSSAVGSRNNSWESLDGNLFLSFCDEVLNYKVPSQSFSIYFATILVETLRDFGSKTFVKWPNDIYLNDKKVGGVMTNILKNSFVCGIGLNLKNSLNFQGVDIYNSKKEILDKFFSKLSLKPTWNEVFINFEKDFYKSQNLTSTINGEKVSLKLAKLNFDGSINLNKETIPCKR